MGPLEWVMSFLGGAMLLLAPAAVIWGRLRRVRVPRDGWRWPMAPTVYVYRGVDLAAMAQAVRMWRELGHPIGELVRVPADDDYPHVGPGIHVYLDDGTLLLLESGDGRVRAAAALLRTELQRADIVVSREIPLTAEVALHELAHAYGYHHPDFPPSGHLMHFDPARRGTDTRGLRAEEST